MRFVDSCDQFYSISFGDIKYIRKDRAFINRERVVLFSLTHVESVIFEEVVKDSCAGKKSSSERLLSIGWPDKSVGLSSLTMKITTLRRALSTSGFSIVAVKNVGYYIPEMNASMISFTADCDGGASSPESNTEHTESKHNIKTELAGTHDSKIEISNINIIKYLFLSFSLTIVFLLVINWDV